MGQLLQWVCVRDAVCRMAVQGVAWGPAQSPMSPPPPVSIWGDAAVTHAQREPIAIQQLSLSPWSSAVWRPWGWTWSITKEVLASLLGAGEWLEK